MAKAGQFGVGVDVLKSRLKLDPAGAYLFFGEEEYLKKFYLSKFISLVGDGGFGDLNISKYDFSLKGMDSLRGEFDTVPMLGAYRLVQIRSLQPLKLSERDGERLLSLLDDLPKHLIVIIFCLNDEFAPDKAALKKKFPHKLAERLTAVDFSRLSESALVSWMNKGLASSGLRSTDEAARLLVRLCSSDMLKMRAEIDKLENYLRAVGRDLVSADDVRLLVTGDPRAQVYELTDAVLSRDAALALSRFEDLSAMRTEPVWLVSALSRALFNAAAAASGAEAADARALGMADWQLRAYREKARSYDRSYFSRALTLCLECDAKLKSTGLDGSVLVQNLVFSLIRLGAEKKKF